MIKSQNVTYDVSLSCKFSSDNTDHYLNFKLSSEVFSEYFQDKTSLPTQAELEKLIHEYYFFTTIDNKIEITSIKKITAIEITEELYNEGKLIEGIKTFTM